jgi:hypothetical protein
MCSTPLYHKIAHRYHHQQQQQQERRRQQQQQQQQQKQGFRTLPMHRADMIFKFFGTKLFIRSVNCVHIIISIIYCL